MPFYDQGRRIAGQCEHCGASFHAYISDKKRFCSRSCAAAAGRVRRLTVRCSHCGEPFETTQWHIDHWGGKYCSLICANAAAVGRGRMRIGCQCQRCGKPMEVIPARVRGGGGKYCSSKCANARSPGVKGFRAGKVLDRSKAGLVYVATNLVNGKRYIGVTVNLDERRLSHCGAARQGTKRYFPHAIRKYGEEMFRFRVLKRCADMVEAFAEEQRLIGILKPEYNMTAGGEGTVGVKRPPGYINPRRGKPSPLRGRKRDQATVAKMRKAATGRKLNLSDDAREIRRQQARAMSRRPCGPASALQREKARQTALAKRRTARCLEDGRTFSSTIEADAYYGLSRGSVSSCANGTRKSAGGKHFVFIVLAVGE
jgi:group I intron endonuclease